MLADMLSHFSGASNAVQGADPGAGGEVSNSSNQVLYDQGTVQKCYMLLKTKWKLVNVFLEFSISFGCIYHVTLIYKLKNVNGVISIVACFWLILHSQGASASAVYKASKNLGAVGREASDSGEVIPHHKGTTTISLFSKKYLT